MTDEAKRLSDAELAEISAINERENALVMQWAPFAIDGRRAHEHRAALLSHISASTPEHATRQGMTEEKARETPSPLTPRGIADRQIWTFAYDVAFRFRADFSHPGREFFKRAKTIGILIESLVGTDEARDGLESAHGWKQDHPDDHADDPRAMEEISQPNEPGGFIGDIWFGHSQKRNLGTHRWDGEKWKVLPETVKAAWNARASLPQPTAGSTGEVTGLDLEAIEARANAAAQGPWRAVPAFRTRTRTEIVGGGLNGKHIATTDNSEINVELHEADAAFIAYARTDIPALIAEVRALRASTPAQSGMVDRYELADAFAQAFKSAHTSWDGNRPGKRICPDDAMAESLGRIAASMAISRLRSTPSMQTDGRPQATEGEK